MIKHLNIYNKIINSIYYSLFLFLIALLIVVLIYKVNTKNILKQNDLSDKNIDKEFKASIPQKLFVLNSSLTTPGTKSSQEIIDYLLKDSVTNTALTTVHNSSTNKNKSIADKGNKDLQNIDDKDLSSIPKSKEPAPTKSIQIKPTSTPKAPIPTKDISPTPSPKLEYKEEINSSIEERDKEKVLISQILANEISEYYFLYSQLPNIYKDKSKTELTSDFSNTIYLYNGDENKSESLGLTLGSEKKGFMFSRVITCENNKSYDNKIIFIYSEFELKLCKEDGKVESFWIAH